MKKKRVVTVCLSMMALLVCAGSGFAMGGDDAALMNPAFDIDPVVLANSQSTTVTADLGFIGDFEIAPVVLQGNGSFTARLARQNTNFEIVYMILVGFGVPSFDYNIGITPVTISVGSTISDVDDGAVGLVMYGILFSTQSPPYTYSVTMSF